MCDCLNATAIVYALICKIIHTLKTNAVNKNVWIVLIFFLQIISCRLVSFDSHLVNLVTCVQSVDFKINNNNRICLKSEISIIIENTKTFYLNMVCWVLGLIFIWLCFLIIENAENSKKNIIFFLFTHF